MKSREKMPGWQKGTLLGLISFTCLLLIFNNENTKNSNVKNYNFQDNWVCYQKKDKHIDIMHLTIDPFYIAENKIKSEYYEIKEDMKNNFKYEIYFNNTKYADITEVKKNRLEYKKEGQTPYICKRSSKFNHINDFTGKWIGYLNSGKDSNLSQEIKDETKIIITLYKDGIFFTGENLPSDYNYQKVDYLKQGDGEFKIKMINIKNEIPPLEFKIISNKELILKESELNKTETYLKRIDKF